MCTVVKLKKQINKTKTNNKKAPASSLSSCISGTACFIICAISLFVKAANQEAILQFGFARSGELEVNQ